MLMVEIRLLGPPEVWVEGRRLELPTRKLLALLAYLLLEGPTPRARLAELLWEGFDKRARANLRNELYRLKQTPLAAVLREEGGCLCLQGVESDLRRFEQHAARGEWALALALRRDVLLEGLELPEAPLFEEWLLLTREAWEERYRQALFRHAEGLERAGQARAALEVYQQFLRLDPLGEEALRAVMRLFERLGEPGLALESYARFAAFLERELGLPPARETRQLAERIRTGETSPALPQAPPLAGRKREWAALEQAWEAGRVVFVTGEPGVGKTRLIQEFTARRGLRPLFATGRPGDAGVPFATVTRLLRRLVERLPPEGLEAWVRRELSRLLPELGEPPPPMRSGEERLRLFEAIATFVLRGYTPEQAWGADDLQFCDDASLEVLAYLAAQRERLPLLVAYRKGELSPLGEGLVRQHLEAGLGVELELGPLDPEGVREMLAGMGLTLPVEPLHRYTGGNPLFILETVRSLAETGQLAPAEWRNLPRSERVEGLIRQRLERLSPRARKLVQLAAVAGQNFSPALAAQVLELRPLPLAEAQDELEAAGILRKGRFTHDLIREATLEGLSQPVRVALHHQVAQVLERRGGVPAAVIAEHYEAGGELLLAVPHRLRAAREAAAVYRYHEALEEFGRAFADAEGDPPRRLRLILESAEERYRMWLALADWEGMARDLRLSERANQEVGDPTLARQIEIGWADRAFRMGAYGEAIARCQALLAQGGLTPDQQALTQYTLAVAQLNLGRLQEAEEGCREALRTQPSPEWSMHGWVVNTLALCLFQRRKLSEARIRSAQALEHFRAEGDGLGLANALRVAGLLAEAEGEVVRARALLEEALAQARRVGHRVVLGFALTSLLGFALRRGEWDLALKLAEEGLRLAQQAQDPQGVAFWEDCLVKIHLREMPELPSL